MYKNLFDTKLSIIQSPMAGIQDNALAIAFCKAGGFRISSLWYVEY